MAEALDELKLLRPHLVRKADIAALLTGAVDDRTAAGWCDAVVASGEGEFRAAGWAALPASGRPADAVLLAYQVPGEAWVPFALSDAMVRRRDIARLLKDQHQLWSGWAAGLSAQRGAGECGSRCLGSGYRTSEALPSEAGGAGAQTMSR
jgi:hypothetical protein